MICTKCNQEKQATTYAVYLSNKGTRLFICKGCRQSKSNDKYYASHAPILKRKRAKIKNELREKSRQYFQTHKEEIIARRRAKRHEKSVKM